MSVGVRVYSFRATRRGFDKCRYEVVVEVERCQVTNPEQRDVDLRPVAEGTEYLTLHVGFNVIYPHCREPREWNHDYQHVARKVPAFAKLCRLAEPLWNVDLQAGTRVQRAAIEGYKLGNPEWRYEYSAACDLLRKLGLYEDRGYEYGHAWLLELPPPDLLKQVRALCEAIEANPKGRAA